MSAVPVNSQSTPASPRGGAPLLPPGMDVWVFILLALGFTAMYLPAYVGLSQLIWVTDEQGHGPLILALSAWLLFGVRQPLVSLQARPALAMGWATLVVAMLFYMVGAALHILIFKIGSQIFVLAALLLLFKGWAGLRLAWFPLFFMIFMIPLPEALVAAVTAPLKMAVSAVATSVLHAFGYPIGRSGVMLTVGPYQLLVADACAGLNSMFTLEALGMLYMNLMRYTSAARNTTLAILLVPIAFFANIIRVCILVLVTYHFGDEAGQGFVHGFAGMVLFMTALMLMLVADKLLNFIFPVQRGAS